MSGETVQGTNVFISEYGLGEFVYLVTDEEGKRRIVSSVQFTQANVANYQLACGPEFSWHYPIEISREKPVVLTNDE
jgi:hypothetical protein